MSAKRKAAEIVASSTAKKPKANGTITSFFAKTPTTTSTASSTTGVESTASTTTTSSSSLPTDTTSASSTTVTSQVSTFTPAKWDKEAWVGKLTAEQKDLLKLEIDTLDESWLRELRDDICSKDFLELKKFLKKEKEQGKTIFPPEADIYSWSRHTPLNTVRIVILGQDPYHNVNQAHGLAFSVRPPVPPPPSLKNMFKALKERDYPPNATYPPGEPGGFSPPPNNRGLLTPWADRGVLLLNTCLTVRAHEANSHSNHGWEKFTQKVIDVVNKKGGKFLPGSDGTGGVVFLAWGAPAGKRVASVTGTKHCVLKTVHPSPLSAHRGFFDAEHFKKANAWLQKKYGVSGMVDWNLGGKDTLEAGL